MRRSGQGNRLETPHRHRLLIGALFALGTVIGIVAVLAVWVNRQALNTDNWTETSSQVLADEHVQTALSAYLVTELFRSGEVQAAVESRLPSQLQGLSGPAASGLQQVAGQAAPKLLASSQAQGAWEKANRGAHTQLMNTINGGGGVVSTNEGAVTLDLHALVSELAARLGIEEQVAAAQSKAQGSAGTAARNAVQGKLGVTLPPSSGQLEILRSDQLKTAQDVAGAIKGLAIVLPLLTFALCILAVWLSKGRRRVGTAHDGLVLRRHRARRPNRPAGHRQPDRRRPRPEPLQRDRSPRRLDDRHQSPLRHRRRRDRLWPDHRHRGGHRRSNARGDGIATDTRAGAARAARGRLRIRRPGVSARDRLGADSGISAAHPARRDRSAADRRDRGPAPHDRQRVPRCPARRQPQGPRNQIRRAIPMKMQHVGDSCYAVVTSRRRVSDARERS